MTREWLVYRDHAHAHAVWATATTDRERRAGALCVLRCEGLPDIESPRVCVLWTDGAAASDSWLRGLSPERETFIEHLAPAPARIAPETARPATITPAPDPDHVSPIPEPQNGV